MISVGRKEQGAGVTGAKSLQLSYSTERLSCKSTFCHQWLTVLPALLLAFWEPGNNQGFTVIIVPFAERSGLPVDHHGCHICL